MRVRLISYMLEYKSNFPPDCFGGFPEVCVCLGQKLFEKKRFHNAIDIFQAGER